MTLSGPASECPSRVGLLFCVLFVRRAGDPVAPHRPRTSRACAFPGKRILILHSYFKGYKWTDDEHRGITSILEPAVGAENIYVEYLDTKRFYWDSYLVQLSSVYQQKYGPYRPDLVIVTDNNAFDFMRRFGETIFPGVPVVFCGVNYAQETDLIGHPNFTGVSEEADLKASLDTALRLQPQARNVFTLVGTAPETGNAWQPWQRSAPAHLCGTWEPALWGDADAAESLAPQQLFFYTFFSRDTPGICSPPAACSAGSRTMPGGVPGEEGVENDAVGGKVFQPRQDLPQGKVPELHEGEPGVGGCHGLQAFRRRSPPFPCCHSG